MTTALFVDTYTRALNVSMVSVTEVPGMGLVIRNGVTLGCLEHLVNKDQERPNWFPQEDMPILVATRGYEALSSAGFTELLMPRSMEHEDRDYIVGVLGMPWMKSGGLRMLRNPINVKVFAPGTGILPLPTHGNSNEKTANAAFAGMKLMVDAMGVSILAEGQSDVIQGWKFVLGREADSNWTPNWPREHNQAIFSHLKMVRKVLRLDHNNNGTELRNAILMAALAEVSADGWSRDREFFNALTYHREDHIPQMWLTRGYRELKYFAMEFVEALKAEGLRFWLDPREVQPRELYRSTPNPIHVWYQQGSQVESFEIEVVDKDSIWDGAFYQIEEQILQMAVMPEEDKKLYRARRDAMTLQDKLQEDIKEFEGDGQLSYFSFLVGYDMEDLEVVASAADPEELLKPDLFPIRETVACFIGYTADGSAVLFGEYRQDFGETKWQGIQTGAHSFPKEFLNIEIPEEAESAEESEEESED